LPFDQVIENHRIIEVGTTFDCPIEQLGLVQTGPAGEQLGWMIPVGFHTWATMIEDLARPAPAHPRDGLWPVGQHTESLRIPQ
jgi:hypothetical protein